MIRSLKGEIGPARWLDSANGSASFGKNPWSDIYTEDVVSEIAGTIGLKEKNDVYDLRVQLAATAE